MIFSFNVYLFFTIQLQFFEIINKSLLYYYFLIKFSKIFYRFAGIGMIVFWFCFVALWTFVMSVLLSVLHTDDSHDDQADNSTSLDELPQGYIYIIPKDSKAWQCKRCGASRKAKKNRHFNNFLNKHRFTFQLMIFKNRVPFWISTNRVDWVNVIHIFGTSKLISVIVSWSATAAMSNLFLLTNSMVI